MIWELCWNIVFGGEDGEAHRVNGEEADGVNGGEADGVNGGEADGLNGGEADGVNGGEADGQYHDIISRRFHRRLIYRCPSEATKYPSDLRSTPEGCRISARGNTPG